MEEDQSCGLCRFWVPIWKLESGREKKRSTQGACHRHAPHSSALTLSWPTTKADEWCGEFEARKNERGGRK